jgi:hypothetical protein
MFTGKVNMMHRQLAPYGGGNNAVCKDSIGENRLSRLALSLSKGAQPALSLVEWVEGHVLVSADTHT